MFRKEKSVKILSVDVHRQCLLFLSLDTPGGCVDLRSFCAFIMILDF